MNSVIRFTLVAFTELVLLTLFIGCTSSQGLDPALEGTGSAEIVTSKLLPAQGADYARFGHAVAVDGDTVVVGAWGESTFGDESGAVHVFRRSASGWEREAVLNASDATAGARFGYSVDIEAGTIAVGAIYEGSNGRDAGAVYIFRRDDSGWAQAAKLTPETGAEDAHFGRSVALSGGRLLVGAPGPGSAAAHLYRRESGAWVIETVLRAADVPGRSRFGSSVALSGDTAAIGAWTDASDARGSVIVYRRSGTSWTESQRIDGAEPEDRFGYSVALEGGLLVVGAPDSGMIHVYRESDGQWSQLDVDIPNSSWARLGHSVAVSSGTILAGDPAFDESAQHEGRVMTISPQPDGLSSDPGPTPPDVSPGKSFGISVAVSGAVTVVGATGDEENGTAAGAAYIFCYCQTEP
jgi:hypothetical protein